MKTPARSLHMARLRRQPKTATLARHDWKKSFTASALSRRFPAGQF
jgi:hypothetical protein